MLNIIKSERFKFKHTTMNKMMWLIPLATGFITVMVMPNQWGQLLAYNMWYTLFLPFLVGYISSTLLSKDRNHLFHGMLGIFEDKKKLWIGKCLYGTILIVVCNLVMALIGSIFYKFFGNFGINISRGFVSMFVLAISVAWQVPLFMLIARKVNFVITTFICTVLNITASIALSMKLWWIPFAIPARLMCPLLNLYPNGISIEEGSQYLNSNVILPGLIITIALFFINLIVTAKFFEKAECNS